ncbi:hypothetical protein FQA39_LY03390 [Lamprigera yunnana]|nr:hypothetical protein FQA39_LY03390 [Lamprigera yunnana]
MRRSARNQKRESLTTNNNVGQPPKQAKRKAKPKGKSEDSSSESDIENYLQPANKIDLNSSFFQLETIENKDFAAVENDIFAGTNRLSDSDSELETEKETKGEDKGPETIKEIAQTSKLNFEHLHSYSKKIEETKRLVEKYVAKKKDKAEHAAVLTDDVSNLLLLGETKVEDEFRKSIHSSDFESNSESEREDWEEVHEDQLKPSCSVPKQGVEITIGLPENMKKKKGVDLVASLKRRLNRIKKENQVLIHKVHLLCWVAHGNYVNKVLNSESLLTLSLSLIPSQHCYPANRTDLTYLEQIVSWYKDLIPVVDKKTSKAWSLEKVLQLQLGRKQAYNKQMLVYMFICMLRSLGLQCRLVLSFRVLPLRPPFNELHSLSTKTNPDKNVNKTIKKPTLVKNENKNDPETKFASETRNNKSKTKTTKSQKKPNPSETRSKETKTKIKKETAESDNKVQNESSITKKPRLRKLKKEPQSNVETDENKPGSSQTQFSKNKTQKKISKTTKSNEENSKTTKKDTNSVKKPVLKNLKKKNGISSTKSLKIKNIAQLDGADDSESEDKSQSKKPSQPNLKKLKDPKKSFCKKNHPKRLKSLPNYKERDESDDDFEAPKNVKKSPSKGIDIKNDIISIMKNRMKQEQSVQRSRLIKGRRSKTQYEEDSDYAPEPIKRKYSDDEFMDEKVKVKQRVQVKESEPEEKEKKGFDMWVEVFLEAEEKWISVDVIKGVVHCVSGLHSRASHPVSYIIAWNNNNSIKDITQRYCTNWNTTTRKLRVEPKWWTATLKPYIGQKTPRDKEEDEELAQLQLDKPLPKSIGEYKNHPLYALKRHLLKFQALYPPNPPPLGFIRNEPVYARECVHILHSREMWLKEAKVVKPGEQAYKIVKARPKYDKLSGKTITDLPLQIFGSWQIEDYVPPTAENGIVPKSAYGSVELFKPCMLPKGTVHLKLPGLNKIARKLNIDSAPALVGFDFHSGWNHPIYDGYVVCKEFEEILNAAWNEDQVEQGKREFEKIEKRVYGNWKKLIKGLLIRERLKKKYDYGELSQANAGGKKRKIKEPTLVTKKRRICSDSDE